MVGDLLQPTHLLFVLVVALLVLGPKRLPEVGRMLGRGLRDFRSAISGEETPERTIAPTEQAASSTTPTQQPVATPEPSTSATPTETTPGAPSASQPSSPGEPQEGAEAANPSEAVTTSMRSDSAA